MSASNTFINQAVGIVTDAINADKDGEYERALGLYKRSLDYFMKGLEYEKNKSARVRLLPPSVIRTHVCCSPTHAFVCARLSLLLSLRRLAPPVNADVAHHLRAVLLPCLATSDPLPTLWLRPPLTLVPRFSSPTHPPRPSPLAPRPSPLAPRPSKDIIMGRIQGYMDRAEQLKVAIAEQKAGPKKKAAAAATGGGGKGGEGKDDESDKLKEALGSAIVSEKPDVKWDDVAGLEAAKSALKEVRGWCGWGCGVSGKHTGMCVQVLLGCRAVQSSAEQCRAVQSRRA